MDIGTPTELAQTSFGFIDAAAREARMSMDVNGAAVLVDGTAYSPSTRAVPGADMVYLVGTDDEWEEYQEELDQLCEAYAEHGFSLGWEDGCLFIYGPRYHPEDGTVLDPDRQDELSEELESATSLLHEDTLATAVTDHAAVRLLRTALEQLDHALVMWADLAMESEDSDAMEEHRVADELRDTIVQEYRQLKEGL